MMIIGIIDDISETALLSMRLAGLCRKANIRAVEIQVLLACLDWPSRLIIIPRQYRRHFHAVMSFARFHCIRHDAT